MRCAKVLPLSNRVATKMFTADAERLQQLLVEITEVAAPPFAEETRSNFVAELWRSAGLKVEQDELYNLIAPLPGPAEGPLVLLVAHLDTVFPAGTDVTVQKESDTKWRAPGIGDNSASLAALTYLAEEMVAGNIAPFPARVTLVATVGEEGLGDLRGAHHIAERFAGEADVFLAVDGTLGWLVDAAVGSKRLDVTFHAKGGHSWANYGAPSAVHALGDAMWLLNHRLEVPDEPRSSYNVGTIKGGSSINAIAETASMQIDFRSVDPEALDTMVGGAVGLIQNAANSHNATVELNMLGDRPAGRSAPRELVEKAAAVMREGGQEINITPSSTDANAAIARGIPAFTVGVYTGGSAHRLSEWLDPTSLAPGVELLVRIVRAISA